MKWSVIVTSAQGEEQAIFVETDENIAGSLASITAIGLALEKLEDVGYRQIVRNVTVRWLHLEVLL